MNAKRACEAVKYFFLTAKNAQEREEGRDPAAQIKMEMKEDALYGSAEQFFVNSLEREIFDGSELY